MRSYLRLFILLSVVYHSNLRPIAAGDSLPAALLPFSIVLDGSVKLDRFGQHLNDNVWYARAVLYRTAEQHWYSVYPIAGPMLAAPLYLPIALVPGIRDIPPGTLVAIARIFEKAIAVAFAAITAVALLALLRRLTTERTAWMLTLVFALATGNWSTSSQAMWQHTFGGLAIVACLYAVARWSPEEARWDWIAGLAAGLALAIRPTNLALLPALGLALWLRPARPAQYARVFALPVVAGLAVAAYNLLVFARLGGGYPTQLDGPFVDGLFGILLSPGRGLLIYTPITFFAFAAFSRRAREARSAHRPLVAAASAFAVLHVGLIALWPVWWGGYCWGPRLLTETLAPIVVLIAIGWPAIATVRWKPAFACVAVYCFFIQALGVYCYPKGRWDHLPMPVNDAPVRLWSWRDNPIGRTMEGGLAWEPYAIVGAMATGGRSAAAKKLQELGINSY